MDDEVAGDEEDGREEWQLGVFMFGGCSRISLLSNQLLLVGLAHAVGLGF